MSNEEQRDETSVPSVELDALRRIVTPLTNQGLDDFRMGRASNDELTRRMVEAILAAGFRL